MINTLSKMKADVVAYIEDFQFVIDNAQRKSIEMNRDQLAVYYSLLNATDEEYLISLIESTIYKTCAGCGIFLTKANTLNSMQTKADAHALLDEINSNRVNCMRDIFAQIARENDIKLVDAMYAKCPLRFYCENKEKIDLILERICFQWVGSLFPIAV